MITTTRGGRRGGRGGGIRGAWTAPTWPSSGKNKEQGTQLPGSGGSLVSRPCVKSHQTINHGPYNDNICRITRGGQVRDTEVWRDPQWANPPVPDRGLGAGWGRKRGERTGTGNGDRLRHTERGTGTSGRGWQVAGAGGIQVGGALHRERRWVAVFNKRSLTMNGCG